MALLAVSTFNGRTQTAGVATSLIICTQGLPVVQSIKGYCNGTANTQYFLQFFRQSTVPTDTSVPLLSLQVLGVDGFIFNDKPTGWDSQQLRSSVGLTTNNNGLIVCLSTTEATLTLATGGVTMDIAVEVDTGELPILGQTSVGDTTTAVASLLVAADPSQNKIMSFNVTNNTGGVAYLMLFGLVPSTGMTPVQQWKFTSGQNLKMPFGSGFFILDGDSNYAIHTGIYLYGSSTTQIFTASAANWTMQANYL